MAVRQVTWTKEALGQLRSAITYIRRQSPQNADLVKARILEKTNALSDDKQVHRKDPHKLHNDGSFLYFEFLRFRIVYRVVGNEVFIVRLAHASQEPKPY